MNPIIQKRYDKAGPRVAAALRRRNMEAFYCPTAIEGAQKVLELIEHMYEVDHGHSAK